MHSRTKEKIEMFLFFGVFVAFAIFIAATYTGPKTPATVEYVSETISSHGYTPIDIAATYYERQPDSKAVLKSGVGFQKGDIHFDFFVSYDIGTSKNMYAETRHVIIDKCNAWGNKNASTAMANYAMFTLQEEGTYNIVMRVENTLVYAYCKEENKGKINSILRDIGYLK